MKEAYKPKHLANSPKQEKTKKKVPVLVIVLVAMLIVAVVILIVMMCQQGTTPETIPEATPGRETVVSEPTEVVEASEALTEVPTEAPITYTTFETGHGPVQIDANYADMITYEELQEGDITHELYFMPLEDNVLEVYRISFGDASLGDLFGYLDGRPVTVMVTPHEDTDFPNEQSVENYYGVMEQLNAILMVIREREDFAEELTPQTEIMPEVPRQDASLTYWNVELPENVEWEENTSDDIYTVDFYGTINDQRIKLYTISLGDTDVDSIIGQYSADGVQQVVGVTIHTAESGLNQSNVEYSTMMDTINIVLSAIMESDGFSDEIPE